MVTISTDSEMAPPCASPASTTTNIADEPQWGVTYEAQWHHWIVGREIAQVFNGECEPAMLEKAGPLFKNFPINAKWTFFLLEDGMIHVHIANRRTVEYLTTQVYCHSPQLFSLPEILECFQKRQNRPTEFETTEFKTVSQLLHSIVRAESARLACAEDTIKDEKWWQYYHYLHLSTRYKDHATEVVVQCDLEPFKILVPGKMVKVFFNHILGVRVKVIYRLHGEDEHCVVDLKIHGLGYSGVYFVRDHPLYPGTAIKLPPEFMYVPYKDRQQQQLCLRILRRYLMKHAPIDGIFDLEVTDETWSRIAPKAFGHHHACDSARDEFYFIIASLGQPADVNVRYSNLTKDERWILLKAFLQDGWIACQAPDLPPDGSQEVHQYIQLLLSKINSTSARLTTGNKIVLKS